MEQVRYLLEQASSDPARSAHALSELLRLEGCAGFEDELFARFTSPAESTTVRLGAVIYFKNRVARILKERAAQKASVQADVLEVQKQRMLHLLQNATRLITPITPNNP